jgi:NHL repeat
MKSILRPESVLTFLLYSFILFISSCSKSPAVSPDVPDTRQWYVSTYAGTGASGRADGSALSSTFSLCSNIALDTAGNLYVADKHWIRKISKGQVTTIAGRGMAEQVLPYGNIFDLAVNKAGQIFNIEYSLIRKINSISENTVFAGSLMIQYKDGVGQDAAFYEIYNLAMDRDENLIIPDYDRDYNTRIRKVTPAGVVTTLPVTDNTGINPVKTASGAILPAVTVDPSGNIYYTSANTTLIKKRDTQGNVTIFAGDETIGSVDGKGTAARFNPILAMTCDASGNIFLVENFTHTVRKITPDGTATTLAGKSGPGFLDGNASVAMFVYPTDIAVDKSGALYIADAGNNRIRKMEFK